MQSFIGEEWKLLQFDFEYTNDLKVEVSNFGRVRSFVNGNTEPHILKGCMTEGYRVAKLKFFKEKNLQTELILNEMRAGIRKLESEAKRIAAECEPLALYDYKRATLTKQLLQKQKEMETAKKKYAKEYKAAELKRTINKSMLVHRLVAEYFVKKETPKHSIVAHLDYNKTNNHFRNLQWMTQKENTIHREQSPYVIAYKLNRVANPVRYENSKTYKLTSTKVMLIKKRINDGVSLRKLSKVFKVTETQLLRIKRGENWAHIKAAN